MKRSWLTMLYAPYECLMELIPAESFWVFDDGSLEFHGKAQSGLYTKGEHAIGPGSQHYVNELPGGLQLTWFSVAENKYYNLRTLLPRKKLKELFKQVIYSENFTNKHRIYFHTIDIVIGLNGFVSLRVGNNWSVEFFQGQAQALNYSLWPILAQRKNIAYWYTEQQFIDEYLNGIPKYLKKSINLSSLPIHKWQKICKAKFPWRFESRLEQIYGYRLICINGEQLYYPYDKLSEIQKHTLQSPPASIRLLMKRNHQRIAVTLFFTQTQGIEDLLDPEFFDEEILLTFQNFFINDNIKSVSSLVLEQTDDTIIAYLTDGVKKQKINIFKILTTELSDNSFINFNM